MAQTYLDNESLKILKDIRDEMKNAGMRGATLGDAVRKLKQAYDEKTGKLSPSLTWALRFGEVQCRIMIGSEAYNT